MLLILFTIIPLLLVAVSVTVLWMMRVIVLFFSLILLLGNKHFTWIALSDLHKAQTQSAFTARRTQSWCDGSGLGTRVLAAAAALLCSALTTSPSPHHCGHRRHVASVTLPLQHLLPNLIVKKQKGRGLFPPLTPEKENSAPWPQHHGQDGHPTGPVKHRHPVTVNELLMGLRRHMSQIDRRPELCSAIAKGQTTFCTGNKWEGETNRHKQDFC